MSACVHCHCAIHYRELAHGDRPIVGYVHSATLRAQCHVLPTDATPAENLFVIGIDNRRSVN